MVGDVELALDTRADLGEAPSWDGDARLLIWVDITKGLVHRFDPGTQRDEVFEAGQPVGAAVPTSSGRLALAANSGFLLLDPATGEIDPIVELGDPAPGTGMNDGKCDPAGRFWAGTKDVEGRRALGSLYRLDADHRLTKVLTDVTISNGLAWSPDQRTMYYIDSTTYRIDAFDYDDTSGAVSSRRPHVEIPQSWGLPDGMNVDEEGFLWVAFWGGSAVRRLAPEGRVDAIVRFPVAQVTSCAFGGSDLSELFVTSARSGLTDAALGEQPLAGGLFRVRPGVRGLPSAPFAG
ncbi:MAG: SMP-30/gluconolactonase/LRE family protein [Actinomycetota bacterium]